MKYISSPFIEGVCLIKLDLFSKTIDKSKASFIHNHQVEKHNNEEADFRVSVSKSFKDPLSRQVYEGIYIRKNLFTSEKLPH